MHYQIKHIALRCSATHAILIKNQSVKRTAMTKTIAVINQKGGVGKTATAYNLAMALSANGLETLLVDFDPSGNASRGLISHIDDLDVPTVSDLLLDKKFDPFCAIIPSTVHGKKMPHLHVIPAKISLAKTQRDMLVVSCKEIRLERQLVKIRNHFQYIIIDCLPSLTELTVNAVQASNFILIPISYEKDALEGMSDLFEIISDVKEDEDFDYRILRNKYDARKKTANHYVETKLAPFIERGVVFNTIIPQDEEINKAKMNYEPVLTFNPHCNASHQYNALMHEVINHE